MKVKLFLALICSACLMSYAIAAVIVNTETDKAPAGVDGAAYSPTFAAGGPSSTDLIEGAAPSAETNAGQPFTEESSTGTSALTNGTVDTFYGGGTSASNHIAYFVGDGGDSLTYDLGGSHDLSSIVIFGGWNDGGRDQQLYEVFASTDGGSNFSSLASVDVNDGIFQTDTTPISTRNELVDDTSSILASGVTHVRVDFGESENGFTGYTEIDINAVPEPTSIALVLVGCTTMLLRRRA